MISDYRYQLSTAQQVLTGTNVESTNNVDLSGVLRDIGSGTPLYVDFHITESFTVANAATDTNTIIFGIKLASAGDVATTLVGLSIVHYNVGAESSPGVAAGAIAMAGDHIIIPVSPLSDGQRRFMQLAIALAGFGAPPFQYLSAVYDVDNVAGAGFTAGKVSASLTTHPTSRVGIQYLADAVN